MPPEITIFFVFVVAMFVQTSTGFGSALIAMSFLISLFGPDVARPLFAISFSSVAIVITYRYRHHLKFKKIWRIMLITIISIPIGVNIIPSLNPTITKAIFGVFVSAYALYSILGFKPARLQSTGWQWVAGSGADAAPYFRIFNPVTQSQKFDPDGAYIRRFVPELATLPAKYLHDPSAAPAMELSLAGIELGKDYPAAIVDLKQTRERALAAYKTLRD